MSSVFMNATPIVPFTMLPDNTSVPATDNVTNATAAYIDSTVKNIEYITSTVFLIVGIIGNTLTLVIMSSKQFKSSTTSIYLSALAVSDMVFIILSPFTKHFINELIGIDIRALSQSGCKAFMCFIRSAKLCSSWFVVIICIERFIVIWFPIKARIISTKSSATFAVFAVVVSAFTLCGFWTMVDDLVDGVCIPNLSEPDNEQLATFFVISGIVMINTIPTAVIIVFTPLTILKLFRQQSLRRNMNITGGNLEVIHITKTLLCVMIAYVVLLTPIATTHAVAFFSGANIFRSKDPHFVYLLVTLQILVNINFSINFLLYVVSNKTFRGRLFEMFGCESRRHHWTTSRQYAISSNTDRSLVSISTTVN